MAAPTRGALHLDFTDKNECNGPITHTMRQASSFLCSPSPLSLPKSLSHCASDADASGCACAKTFWKERDKTWHVTVHFPREWGHSPLRPRAVTAREKVWNEEGWCVCRPAAGESRRRLDFAIVYASVPLPSTSRCSRWVWCFPITLTLRWSGCGIYRCRSAWVQRPTAKAVCPGTRRWENLRRLALLRQYSGSGTCALEETALVFLLRGGLAASAPTSPYGVAPLRLLDSVGA